ncbi:MAG TPA: electron transport complex subunit RsxD [Gammaproteobacteria bacterium]|nr:electron transport complex subunit RsxD [Gammaproteobacteria bacterium]
MEFHTYSSPHLPVPGRVSLVMRRVLYALVPGALAYVGFFGWGVVFNLLLCVGVGLAAEAAMVSVRGRPVAPALADGSALVTAALLGLALPPLAPWYIPVVAILFAIVIAKQLYGGLGNNPFNPAMVGYVVVLISFPQPLSLWVAPLGAGGHHLSLAQTAQVVLGGHFPQGMSWDALSAATPLDAVKIGRGLNKTMEEIRRSPVFGDYGGIGWEWVNLGYLIGGLWLLRLRVIRWQIPAGLLGSLFAIALVFFLFDPDSFPSPVFHLFSGATMLGAFFIATDPVSASTTNRGRLIYGAGIGLLVYVIRTWGGYPEGMAFAVLLMNMAAPTIDYYTRPPVFGESGD